MYPSRQRVALPTLVSAALFLVQVPVSAQAAEPRALPLADLQTVTAIWNRIWTDYVDPVSDKRLLEGCISGMASLDPSSGYLTASELSAMEVGRPGGAAGIGLEMSLRHGRPMVVAPIEGGPADLGGVRSGDVLLEVDGNSVVGLPLSQVVAAMQGPMGSQARVSVWRDTTRQFLDLQLERRDVVLEPASVQLLAGDVVYLRLRRFTHGTAARVQQRIDGALRGRQAAAYIIDLRQNTGGMLDDAIRATALFVEGQPEVLQQERRAAPQTRTLVAPGPGPYVQAPVAVLVDKGTAAGAEIMAAALRQYRSAHLFGETTFGRGSIQTIMPLTGGAALKLTTSRWKTGTGQLLDGTGLTPDVLIEGAAGFAKPIDEDPALQAARAWLRALAPTISVR